jgi:hypothetical protein
VGFAAAFGVGTKRRAKLMNVLLRVDEEYFIWEEGRRMAFFVTGGASSGLPALRGGLPRRGTRSRIVNRMFVDTRRHFDRLGARRNPTS